MQRGGWWRVAGSRIVRCSGRKDRHSKVFTAKGLRDRRVRLSAHTAIQFYDVQDRLGCDRPSKVIDWLIQHARAAIDQLVEPRPAAPREAHVPDEKSVVPHLGYNFGGGNGFFHTPPSRDAIKDSTKPAQSAGWPRPLLPLNCSCVPPALLERETTASPCIPSIVRSCMISREQFGGTLPPRAKAQGNHNVAEPQANGQFPLRAQREPLQSNVFLSLREWANPIPTSLH